MNTKDELLKQKGYRYNFYRMVYISREARKIFSAEYIDDHPVDVLEAKMSERNNGSWQFYFNEGPPPAVERTLLAELDGRRAAS